MFKAGIYMKFFRTDFKKFFFVPIFLAFLLYFQTLLYGEETLANNDSLPSYELNQPIVVTATRIPTAFEDILRSITVLDSSQISNGPVQNIQDLLEYVAGVDVRQQGIAGAQADVSIRGATFEQTLVLINGIKLSDPQTGHHNFNLPIDLSSIEQIEILKGPGSRIYGPNAFGGVINIITKTARTHQLNWQAVMGSNKTYYNNLLFTIPVGKTQHHISLTRQTSAGYRENTEYNQLQGFYQSTFQLGSDRLNIVFGYNDKKFGANSFYGSTSTRQWEHTETSFFNSGLEIQHNHFKIVPKIYWRNNKDHYIWNREHPEWYENFHTTNVYGGELQTFLMSRLGIIALGAEFSREFIASSKLGNHDRSRGGLFVQFQKEILHNLKLTLGTSAYHYSNLGWKTWPGFDLGFKVNSSHTVYASFGKAFRVPTYTELFYSDPNNQGNPMLHEEEAWTVEVGHRFQNSKFRSQFSIFRRESQNLIDWVWMVPDSVWYAQNITKLNTTGLEMGFQWLPPDFIPHFRLNYFSFNYAYLHSSLGRSYVVSKYKLNHLRHQLTVGIGYTFFHHSLNQNWFFRYEDRMDFEDHFILDTRIIWQRRRYSIFFDITNVLNQNYRDNLLIPMPSRRVHLGVEIYFLK